MRMDQRSPAFTALGVFLGVLLRPDAGAGEPVRITVQADAPGQPVASTMHGLFFEDINYAADGGLYAELVENRSFEHRDPKHAWIEVARGKGSMTIETESPLNASNTRFLRLRIAEPGEQEYGAANAGFDGIALREGDRHRFSVHARSGAGGPASLKVLLEDGAGQPLAQEVISGLATSWSKLEATLTSPRTVADARLVVLAPGAGTVVIQIVNPQGERRTAAIRLAGLGKTPARARVTTLTGDGPGAENTRENPEAVKPRESEITIDGPELEYALEPYSLTTLRIRTN